MLGSVEEIMACPGFRELKQHRRVHSSRCVSLWVYQFGREILYGQVTDGGELGNNGYYN